MLPLLFTNLPDLSIYHFISSAMQHISPANYKTWFEVHLVTSFSHRLKINSSVSCHFNWESHILRKDNCIWQRLAILNIKNFYKSIRKKWSNLIGKWVEWKTWTPWTGILKKRKHECQGNMKRHPNIVVNK